MNVLYTKISVIFAWLILLLNIVRKLKVLGAYALSMNAIPFVLRQLGLMGQSDY